MNEYLFSYGTLQKEHVQLELFGRNLKGSSDQLRGYSLSSIDIKDPEELEKSEQKYHLMAIRSGQQGDVIEGTALEVLAAELTVADAYEPEEYVRVRVTLESGKNAWAYVGR